MNVTSPRPLALPLELETPLYLVRGYQHGDTPRHAEVVTALLARHDPAGQQRRIREHGAVTVTLADMYWLEAGGSETLLATPFSAVRFQIRRPTEAPQWVRALDLLKGFIARGWISEAERRTLPACAVELVQ